MIDAAAEFVLSCGELLPAYVVITASACPRELAKHLCGGRRSSTLKSRVREARKLQGWLMSICGKPWLTSPGVLMDYIMERSLEPCAPSIPNSIIACVDCIESIGGVPEVDRHSRNTMVMAVVKDITMQLKGLGPRKEKQKAPPTMLATMISLEALVVDTSAEKYPRIYAWSRLIRVWAALRCSDLLHMPPGRATFISGNLTMCILQTKTTGPGKKVEILWAYVHADAWLMKGNWLSTGWNLFLEMGHLERECWIPKPTKDRQGFTDDSPKYLDSCGCSRKIFSTLKSHRRVEVGPFFVESSNGDGESMDLFLAGVQSFFKEHSDRSTLPGWMHLMGFSKEDRDLVGRWSPQGSDDYVRVSRTAVWRVQSSIAGTVRKGVTSGDLGEDDTWHKLAAFMLSRDFTFLEIENQLQVLGAVFTGKVEKITDFLATRAQGPSQELGPPLGPEEAPQEDSGGGDLGPEVDDDWPDWLEGLPPGSPKAVSLGSIDSSDEADVLAPPKDSWVLCLERGGRKKTLHKIGFCWRVPGIHYARFIEISSDEAVQFCEDAALETGVPEGEFNPKPQVSKHCVCKNCFPQGTKGPPLARSSSEVSLSDSGASSSDSSDSSKDP